MVKESGYGSSFQELILIELTKNKDCEVYLQTFDDLCLPFFFCFFFNKSIWSKDKRKFWKARNDNFWLANKLLFLFFCKNYPHQFVCLKEVEVAVEMRSQKKLSFFLFFFCFWSPYHPLQPLQCISNSFSRKFFASKSIPKVLVSNLFPLFFSRFCFFCLLLILLLLLLLLLSHILWLGTP